MLNTSAIIWGEGRTAYGCVRVVILPKQKPKPQTYDQSDDSLSFSHPSVFVVSQRQGLPRRKETSRL